MFKRILILVAISVVIFPMLAWATFYRTSGNAGYYAEQMLTATDLVNTPQISRWVSSPDANNLLCFVDVTAISGAAATVIPQLQGCMVQNMVAGECVDQTDDLKWYAATGMTTVSTQSFLVSTHVSTDVNAAAATTKFTGPIPPIWTVFINETGDTTVTYTVDCVWW